MPSLAESLSQVMTIQGARAAALIDIATGMIVQSAGQHHRSWPRHEHRHDDQRI